MIFTLNIKHLTSTLIYKRIYGIKSMMSELLKQKLNCIVCVYEVKDNCLFVYVSVQYIY